MVEIDLIEAQNQLRARIIEGVKLSIDLLSNGKAPKLAQIIEHAQTFAAAIREEYDALCGKAYAENVCRLAAVDADLVLHGVSGPVASYSAVLLACFRYRAERTD